MTPKISIIMPLYNSEQFVLESVQSVEKQTFSDWELLIVDDCSSDKGLSLIQKKYGKDKRISFYKNQKNLGPGESRNCGLRQAKGDYVAFLDSDDTWDPNFLDKSISILEKSGKMLVTSGYRRSAKKSVTQFLPPQNISAFSILKGNPISCLSTVFCRKASEGLFFDSSLKKTEDLLFWYQFLSKNGDGLGNNEILATYRIHANSRSSKKIVLIRWQWKVYRKIHLSLFKSIYCLFSWAFYGIRKYSNVR